MSHPVTLRYDPTWEALEWAKVNCPSYITNQSHSIPNSVLRDASRIDYFFSDDKEAAIFALRWK